MGSSYEKLMAEYVWNISFWGSLVSLSVLLALVFLRLIHDRRDRRRAERRKEMQRTLMIHMENPLSDIRSLLLRHKEDTVLLAETAVPMLRSLKGVSHDRVLVALVDMGIYDWLEEELLHKDPQRRIHALSLAPYWPDNRIRPTVQGLLEDKHRLVRHAALDAMARMQDSRTFVEVVYAAKADPTLSCPLLFDIFQKFGIDSGGNMVRLVWDESVPDNVRMAAIMALGTLKHPKLAESVIPLCSHANPEMRALAYRMLARSGQAVDDPLLLQGMKDSYWKVRTAAAEAAASATAVPAEALSMLMEDDNWLVSLRAAQSLHASIGGQRLLALLAEKPTRAGKRAAMFLSEQGAS